MRKFRIEVAIKKRHCANCKGEITRGSMCVVNEPIANTKSNLCFNCLENLFKTAKHFQEG